jgi:hypothetical protein
VITPAAGLVQASAAVCAFAAIKNEAIKDTESVLADEPPRPDHQAIFTLLAELSENFRRINAFRT